MRTCLTLLWLTFLMAGGSSESQPLGLKAEEANSLSFLSISCSVSEDGFPPGTSALRLKIENPSERRLDGVRLTFDHEYTAFLQDLCVSLGPLDGAPPLGRSSILPGDEMAFVFSHDVSNHHVLRNAQGESMPRNLIPSSLTIRTEDGVGTWSVE